MKIAVGIGDIVRLLSGGPAMVVEDLADGVAHCVWFDSTHALHSAPFNVGLLEPARVRGGNGTAVPEGVT